MSAAQDSRSVAGDWLEALMQPIFSTSSDTGTPRWGRKAIPLGLALLLAAGPALGQDFTPEDVYRALQSGRVEQAQQMIDRVLAAHPDSGMAYYVAAEVSARRGNFSIAREELARAEQLKPGLPFASPHSVSELRAQLARHSRSRPVTEAADDPEADQIYDAVSDGKLDEAQQLIDRVLAAHPESARAHYVAAEVAAERGKLDVARAELARAEQLKPGLPFTTPSSVAALRAQLAGTARSATALDAAAAQSASAPPAPPQ
jgi:tetratricopeptide (TPR) repeat protein